MRKIEIVDGKLIAKFSVTKGEFPADLALIKSCKGRVFDYVNKHWVLPLNNENVTKLRQYGYTPSKEVVAYYEDTCPIEEKELTLVDIDKSKLIPGLRSYQIEGVQFIETFEGRALIAFAPRLGKSLTSLAWCLYRNKRKILIVCPAISKFVWASEIKKWSQYRYSVLSGRTPYPIDKRDDVLVINYDILHDWLDILLVWNPDVLIVDESHYVATKSRKTRIKGESGREKTVTVPVHRTVSVQALGAKTPHVICLSGTPFLSYPSQMFITLNMLAPKLFSNEYKFRFRYCDPQKTRWGWEFKGATNVKELKEKLKPVMFRKRKEDVFNDLPEEEHILLPIEIDQDEYQREWEKFEEWYREHRGLSEEELDEKLMHLESISYSKKRAAIHDWIRDFIATGQSLVIFAWFRETCLDLHTTFKEDSVLVYGGTRNRAKCIDKFQKGEAQIFIGQISSAKESITLAQSNDVLYAEIPYSAGDLVQSQERVFLPGKVTKNAYYYAVAWDTVDEERYERLMKRVKNLKEVLD